MISSKKGLGMEFIITTSLLLISFFLIAGLLGRFASRTSDLEAELLCQTSIAQRAKTALNIGKDISKGSEGSSLFQAQVKTIPPLCRTIDKKVSGSREQVLRQVADGMARCWWMFGEGRYEEILDNVQADVFPDVLGFEDLAPYTDPESANQCFNCYTILIAQNEIPGGPIEINEINNFLRTKTYAKVNKTYLHYIQGYGGPGRVVFTTQEISPREAYTISMMPKNKKESTFWKGVIQQAAGTVLAASPLGLPLLYIGQQNQLADLIKERDVSSIYVSSLKDGQERCGEGDIAGQ
ncbi:MAG: hypothetical protein Q8R47_01170 [Nanoarchaeota archaeon]|nr:hypothetical protein [Nanoarchaeota archaeon]